MSVSEGLDKFRAAVPGCQLVAFIDLNAGMVLAVSAQTKQRQELLGALGETASMHLPMNETDLAKCLSLSESSAQPGIAVLLSATGTVAFVRSPAEGNEALGVSCSPNVDVDAIITQARIVLTEISAAQ